MKRIGILIGMLTFSFTVVYGNNTEKSNLSALNALAVSSGNLDGNLYLKDHSFDVEKTKAFSKSFPLDKNDKVVLNNMYGGILIKIWDKNEIKVDVKINAYGNSDDEANQWLNSVSIDAVKEGDEASFKTKIKAEQQGRKGNSGNRIEIFYTVYMPINNSLTASQQYGYLTLPSFSGATALKVQYGDLTTGDLTNANNYASVQYGKANFGNINVANIKQQYGEGLVINSVKSLELNAQYSKVSIGSILSEATIDQQYGSGLKINSANNLTLKSQYCGVKIGKANGTLVAKLGYSSLDIENVSNTCKNVEVGASYGDVSLSFASNFNGDFNLGVDYGSFKYGTGITTQKSDQSSTSNSKKYVGKIGAGGGADVAVKVAYGSVKFN